MTFSVDDVLTAHDLLKDYAGNMDGLFDPTAPPTSAITEWRLHAICHVHGDVWNIVSTPRGNIPSESAFVMCPHCLVMGVTRRIWPTLAVRVSE